MEIGVLGIRETVDADEIRASEVNRLRLARQISEIEYRAGVTYAKIILDYLKTIDAPSPYGDDLAAIEDDVCLQRKINMASARKVLSGAGKDSVKVVDRVMVYGEQLAPGELPLLLAGLRALVGK